MFKNILKSSTKALLYGITISTLVGCSTNVTGENKDSNTASSINKNTNKDQVASGSKIGETSSSNGNKNKASANNHQDININQFGGESFSNLLDDKKVKDISVAKKGNYIYVMFEKYIEEEKIDKTFVSIGKIDDKEGKWIIKDKHFYNGEDGVKSMLYGDTHIISNGSIARTSLMDENAKMINVDTSLESSNMNIGQNTNTSYKYVHTSKGGALLVQDANKLLLHLDDGTKKEIKNFSLKGYHNTDIFIDLKNNLLYDETGKLVFDIDKGDYVYDQQGQKLKYGINYGHKLIAANDSTVIANTNNGSKLTFDVYNTSGGNVVRKIESEAIPRASLTGVFGNGDKYFSHFSMTGDYIHYVGLIDYKGKPSIQYKKIYAGI